MFFSEYRIYSNKTRPLIEPAPNFTLKKINPIEKSVKNTSNRTRALIDPAPDFSLKQIEPAGSIRVNTVLILGQVNHTSIGANE